MAPDSFYSIRSKAGALVVVLPEKLDTLTEDEKQVVEKKETLES